MLFNMKLILTLVFIIHYSNAIVDLPGVDVLSSGYDAASWTTKYKIFDFSEEAGPVHIVSINKTFNAPAMVNVVTDGMNSKRVEDSCVDVATHFEEYVYMYQRSTSFDVGVHTDDFSLGLAYHKDVEQVYKSITATGQAVGKVI